MSSGAPSPTLRINAATVADLPQIAALAAVIWHQHYPSIITVEQIDYMLARMYSLPQLLQDQATGVRFDQLLLDDQLAGFSAHGPIAEPQTGKLHKLYVLPARHGQGLGLALLQAAEARGRAEGWNHLILQVNRRNDKALAFYRRNGFVVRECTVLDLGNGFVMDDFIMSKSLAPLTPSS